MSVYVFMYDNVMEVNTADALCCVVKFVVTLIHIKQTSFNSTVETGFKLKFL